MKVNFSSQFQSIVDKWEDLEAIVNVERDRRFTYREFHLVTNKIVNMLSTTFGMERNDRFVNILDNDNMALFHFPTIFKSHFTGAFTNSRDAIAEHEWQIEYSKPKVVFIENMHLATHLEMLIGHGIKVVCMDPIPSEFEGNDNLFYLWDLLAQVSDENPNMEIDDREHQSIIRFTGGTTGKGKPAVYCADNWLGLRDTLYALDEACFDTNTRMQHIAPISHGSGMFLVPTFFSGGCNITLNEPDLVKYCQTIETEKSTHAFLVPTILYRMLEIPEVQDVDFSTMQNMYYGAAPMSPAKLKLLQKKFGNIFIQAYGSTEHFAIALSLSKSDHLCENGDDKHLSSAGRVTAGVEVEIMDDDGEPVKRGEIGEFWLRSRGVCLGYLDNPEKTAEEFYDGYWKSGDMGYKDENGYIYLVDRKKDMIISGGFNIYATEVEAAINAHNAIFMSAVVGIPHEEWGEAVHAEVMLREGEQVSEQELIAFVKESLGSYKSPKSIVIVDQLPLTVVGKVLRKDVRKKYWENSDRAVG